MNAFSRSWQITKLSFGVIKKDKELLLFPVCSAVFSLLFILTMVFPTLVTGFLASGAVDDVLMYGILFIVYFGLAFIATFFNVCTVYTAKKRFEGGNATFMESIQFGFSKIHLIFAWSLLAATVGMLLRLLDRLAERLGNAGQIAVNILTSILGMVWSIITIFVVPAMVYNNLGPIAAIQQSIAVLKKTWGESLIRHFGLGLAQFVIILVGFIICFVLGFFLSALSPSLFMIMILIGVIYAVLVSLVFGIANAIFNTALYVYASTGKIPGDFTEDTLKNTFESRPKRGLI